MSWTPTPARRAGSAPTRASTPGRRSSSRPTPSGATAGFTAPAPAAPLAAPAVAVLGDTTVGDVRTLHLRLTSPRGAYKLQAALDAPGEVVAATVDGRPFDLRDYDPARSGQLQLTYNAVPAAGVELAVTVRSAEPLRLIVSDTSHGLPAIPGMAIRPRPPGYMPALGMDLDPTVVTRSWWLAR